LIAPEAERVLEVAAPEALSLGMESVGTDLLIGLLNEREGIAHAILSNVGVDVPAVLGD
jgi:hypothetical protein